MIDFVKNEYTKLKNLEKEETIQFVFNNLDELCRLCGDKKQQDDFVILVKDVYTICCDYNFTVYDFTCGKREIITNYTAYRQINAAIIISAIFKAKNNR